MIARDQGRLGPRLSVHRPRAGSWLVAAIVAVAFVVLFVWWAATSRGSVVGPLSGALFMGGFGYYAVREWMRLRLMGVALHESGLLDLSGGARLEITWDDVVALEARYVPGVLKKGAGDEGNRVALVLTTSGGAQVDLPKELEGARDLWATVEQRTGKPLARTVVQNLMGR
jgi:hypothetical protein